MLSRLGDHSGLVVHVQFDFKAACSMDLSGVVVSEVFVGAGGVGVGLGESWLEAPDFFVVLRVDAALAALVVPDDIVFDGG